MPAIPEGFPCDRLLELTPTPARIQLQKGALLFVTKAALRRSSEQTLS